MNVYHKGAIPFVLLLIPYLLGIAAGINLFPQTDLTLLLTCLCIALVAFISLNIFYSKWTYKVSWLGGTIMFIVLVITGIANTIQSNQLNNKDHFSHLTAQHLLVKIIDEPVWKNDALKFTVTVEQTVTPGKKIAASGKVLISIKDKAAKNLYYGDVLLIPAKYREVDPPFNPAEFNYKQYLANKNIYHQAYLYPGQYVVIKKGTGNSIIAYALRLRQRLVNKLKANLHDPDAAAVAATLILGYKAELSNDVLQAYSKTGTIHVLSVSGAHVGLVYLVLAFGLSFLNRYRHGRVVKAVIIITLIWFYALLTGFSPPVCRAAVMLSLIITGNTYTRHISSLNILAFSAFVILLFDPLLITDVGFQLSYLAVAGLIVLQPIIYKRLEVKNRWLDKLWLFCSASIAAQVITFPLSAYYFHQVPVYFLISNLFILLPSAIMLCGGILYLFLPQDIVVAKWLGYLLEQTILFTNTALGIIEHAPLAGINKVWLTKIEYVLLYGIIIIVFMLIHRRSRALIGLGIGFVLLFCISVGIKYYNAANTRQMAFLNLRKNAGIVFKSGRNAVVITDLTVDSKAFKWSVQPYLDSNKVSDLKIINLQDDMATNFFSKKGNNIIFLKHKLTIIDKPGSLLPVKFESELIYITGNPKPENISTGIQQSHPTLVINGSNSKKNISVLKQQAQLLNIPVKILPGNKAFIVTSNK
ncbi:MAG: ComEC/Rec2 family competence protein [Mucilaginibacter sp.]